MSTYSFHSILENRKDNTERKGEDDLKQHSLYQIHLPEHIRDVTTDQMVLVYNAIYRGDHTHDRMVHTTVLAKHILVLDRDDCDNVDRSVTVLVRANAYAHNTHESVLDIYQIHDIQATNENHENPERICHNYKCLLVRHGTKEILCYLCYEE